MIKFRLQFSKSGPLRFIGHLDFLKVFQQTISRARLPVAYSQGFHPHMLLSFALPLPLGMTSLRDYADLTLESDLPTDTIISRLNTHAPGGLSITNAREFNGPGAAAMVTAADYLYIMELPAKLEDEGIFRELNIINETIQSLMNRESIIIPKKTKSGIKDTDIRTDILDLSIEGMGYGGTLTEALMEAEQMQPSVCITMRLAAGSARFLNPLIVAGLLLGRDADPASIIRAELYRQAGSTTSTKGLISLNEAPIH